MVATMALLELALGQLIALIVTTNWTDKPIGPAPLVEG